MTYEEIIQKIRTRDEAVTRCFFFWDGPTRQHIDAVRRKDPQKAARMRRPVCDTCRPGILSVLHKIYNEEPFDYDDLVSSFYCYLMDGDKLASIKESKALMGWIVSTAYFFFLKDKKNKAQKLLEKEGIKTLIDAGDIIEDDNGRSESRRYVKEILKAMPNRDYARILDDVVLEVAQYTGAEKTETLRKKAEEMGIPIDNLYVKISLAKKQFKETAKKMK